MLCSKDLACKMVNLLYISNFILVSKAIAFFDLVAVPLVNVFYIMKYNGYEILQWANKVINTRSQFIYDYRSNSQKKRKRKNYDNALTVCFVIQCQELEQGKLLPCYLIYEGTSCIEQCVACKQILRPSAFYYSFLSPAFAQVLMYIAGNFTKPKKHFSFPSQWLILDFEWNRGWTIFLPSFLFLLTNFLNTPHMHECEDGWCGVEALVNKVQRKSSHI